MEIEVAELKQRIDSLPASRDGRRQYNDEIREVVLGHIAAREKAGTVFAVACRELGIHKTTVLSWMDGARGGKKRSASKKPGAAASRVRPVEMAPATVTGAVLVLPGGGRVEGLSIAQLAALAKALA